MTPGPWQLVIILVIVLVLFGGRGKISSLMGDFGKGLKSFKKGMKDEDGDKTDASEESAKLSEDKTETVDQTAEEEKKSG